MRLVFISVEPTYPSNMGAMARALAATGHSSLRFVRPMRSHLAERAVATSRSGIDILRNAEVYADLTSALVDVGFVVGTTRREVLVNKVKLPHLSARNLVPFLQERAFGEKVAILFGPESTGLTLNHLAYCQATSFIPTDSELGSLNLSQAVMLYGYELSPLGQEYLGETKNVIPPQESPGHLTALKAQVKAKLQDLGLLPSDPLLNTVLGRIASMPVEDRQMVFKVLRRLNGKLRHERP